MRSHPRNAKLVKNLFLDNNTLSRALKQGFSQSIEKISAQLLSQSSYFIASGKTNLILTPSGMFEYAGLNTREFKNFVDLESVCDFPDTGNADQYFETLHKQIRQRVLSFQSLKINRLIALLQGKLKYLPMDSQLVVKQQMIDRFLKDPDWLGRIQEAIIFHLFWAARVLPKYTHEHEIYGVFLAIHLFKLGHVASVAKLLPRVWRKIRESNLLILSYEDKDRISKLVGMHDVGDYLDSDLVHLATTGVTKPYTGIVHCFSEDPPDKLRQRTLNYKSFLRTLLVSAREVDKRPGSRDFKDVDLKNGYVTCVNENFDFVDTFQVQKLRHN